MAIAKKNTALSLENQGLFHSRFDPHHRSKTNLSERDPHRREKSVIVRKALLPFPRENSIDLIKFILYNLTLQFQAIEHQGSRNPPISGGSEWSGRHLFDKGRHFF